MDSRSRDALPADSAAFLWKLTARQREALRTSEFWKRDLETVTERNVNYQMQRMGGTGSPASRIVMSYAPLSTLHTYELTQTLRPQSTRLIPGRLLLGMLCVYILAIGPIDYFVLGSLRQRKLTWVVFPLVTVLFTAGSVAMSNHYIGRNDHRQAITLIDLGDGGREIRRSRLEMIFAGQERTERIEAKRTIVTPVREAELLGYQPWRGQSSVPPSPPVYEGRYPSNYTMTQRIRQWSPQVFRTTRLAEVKDESGLNWDAIDPAQLGDGAYRARIGSILGSSDPARPPAVAVMHMSTCESLGHIFVTDNEESVVADGSTSNNRSPRQNHVSPDVIMPTDGSGRFPGSFLTQACARLQEGFFSVVSQVSPTGDGMMEDLSILDPTDPKQWLIMAIEEKENNWVVYRRLYRQP